MNYKRNQRNYTYNLHGCLKDMDEETGLYYYGMRYYAAWLCKFINVDPLQFKYPYYTPFQYAGNKPITYIDLDGGEEADPNNGKITGTIFLRFDTDTDNLTRAEKDAYIQNYRQDIINKWGNNQHCYNGFDVNVDELQILEAPANLTISDLGADQSLLTVGYGASAKPESVETSVSYINSDRKTGYMYLNRNGNEAGHELGHLLGLSDRNVRFLFFDNTGRLHDMGAVALFMKDDFSRNNLMGRAGTVLTQRQLSYVFEHKTEPSHNTPIIITNSQTRISDNDFIKMNGLRAVLGNVNTKNNFYFTNRDLGNVRLINGHHFTYDLGARYTPKKIGTTHQKVFHGTNQHIKNDNYKLILFFSR